MKVKSKSEFQALDEELNLFEDAEWDFMKVVEEQEENYEFFDDIPDIDFNAKKAKMKTVAPFIGIVVIILFQSIWLGSLIREKPDEDYLNFQASLTKKQQEEYIKGNEVSGSEFVEINSMLADYFKTLKSKQGYDTLNNICLNGSAFKREYDASLSKMESTYDKYDCNARALAEFGSYLNLNKIKKAVESDGTYYIYCDVTVPSKDDVAEYIHLYSYNLTKYFTSNEVNTQNVARFLLETMSTNPVPTTTKSICFEIIKVSDGSFRIVDDSEILNISSTAYSYSINQITKVLGSTLTDESF